MLWPALAAVIYLRCRRRRSEQEGKEEKGGEEKGGEEKGAEVMKVGELGVGEAERGGGEGQRWEDRGHEGPGMVEEDEVRQTRNGGGEENLAISVDDEEQESENKATKSTPNGIEMEVKTGSI